MKPDDLMPFQFGQVQVERGVHPPPLCPGAAKMRECGIQTPPPRANGVSSPPSSRLRAHTLAEVMISVGLLSLMVVSLFAGFSSGFDVVRASRENVRATQIMEQRMEVIRLVKWDNLLAPGFIPTSFNDTFYTAGPTNSGSGGVIYTGTVSIGVAPVADATYSNDLRMIQINLNWTSGNVTHNRQMTSFVSRYGMQNYMY